MKRVLITGGAGFIGSHVVRRFVNTYPSYSIVNLDALTYAGNLSNLTDIENKPNYQFIKADINAIDSTKLQRDLNWVPSLKFEEGLEKTVEWYLNYEDWLNNVTSGNYQAYYDNQIKGGKFVRVA